MRKMNIFFLRERSLRWSSLGNISCAWLGNLFSTWFQFSCLGRSARESKIDLKKSSLSVCHD